ncbi:MAG: hypothetical protein HOV80_18170 [Polyangiaceae bacterium]|nr:hypothetical protein [Polyangiaceae bacterium]
MLLRGVICGTAVLALGCSDDERPIDPGVGGGETTSSAASTGSSVATSSSPSSSSSGGGVCEPGQVQPCYPGPAEVAGIGTCTVGSETCLPDGSGYAACEGFVLPSAQQCDSGLDEDCDGFVSSGCSAELTDVVAGLGDASAQAIAFDAQGNLLLGITVHGPSFEIAGTTVAVEGFSDALLVKLSPSLDILWMQSIVGPDGQSVTDIATDPAGRVAIAGQTVNGIDFGDGLVDSTGVAMYVAVYDPDGALVFGRADPGYPVPHITMLPAGDVVVGGSFYGDLSFVDGPSWSHNVDDDPFMVRFDGVTGDLVWAESVGTPFQERLHALATTSDGDIVVTAAAWEPNAVVDLGGGPLSTDDAPIVIARLTPLGEPVWATALGGGAAVLDIGVGPNDDVYVGGGLYGLTDWGGGPIGGGPNDWQIVVARFTASGDHVFSRTFGPPSLPDEGMGIGVDGSGNVVLAGNVVHENGTSLDLGGGLLTTTTDRALFVAKYDETGAHLWSDTFGFDYAATVYDVAAAADGRSALAGGQVGYLDLGTGALEEGPFVALFAP